MKKEEIELTRHDVTPAQFLAYVRYMLRKNHITCVDPMDIDLDYFAAGEDLNFDYKHDDPRMPAREKSVSRPYEMQTYILNRDKTVFNQIMEFNFWDDKTGTGYFYLINTWNE